MSAVMSLKDALEFLGETADGHGTEADEAWEIVRVNFLRRRSRRTSTIF